MKRKKISEKAKNLFVGRILRRLLGEEKGTVMMEYIVVGLLIAAACVVCIAAFGSSINGMFSSLAASMTGDHARGDTIQAAAKADAQANFTTGNNYIQAKHSSDPTTEQGTLVTTW